MISQVAFSDEFRCDTEVFVGTAKEPVQETLTIFTDGLVYDFLLTKPEEVTLYDLGRQQIILLNREQKIRTTLSTDDVLRFTAAYKTGKMESELFNFCANPTFQETLTDGVVTLSSKQVTYRCKTTSPEHSGADRKYREFADWSARLNSMRPGNLPPFARLEVNKALAAHTVVPEEIERTISTVHLTGRRNEVMRSRHLFNWSLSANDRKRIEEVGDQLSTFTSVTQQRYLGLEKTLTSAGK
jgi:hypothetical protein